MGEILRWLTDFAKVHPVITEWIGGTVAVSVLMTNGLRAVWPDYATQPKLVRFALGVFDVFALNFWNLIRTLYPSVKGERTETQLEKR